MSELQFQFAMYNPESDTVEVNLGPGSVQYIRCKEINATVRFDDPNDIVYIYRLVKEQPLTYAKFALSENGLRDYVDAINELN